jgi:hypothetical protein
MPEEFETPNENRDWIRSFPWSRLKGDEHLMSCFPTDAEQVIAVGGFTAEALSSGAAGVVVARATQLNGVEEFLAEKGLDAERLQRQGRYIPLDAVEMLDRISGEGRVDAQRFYEVIGRVISNASNSWGEVRAFGEMVGMLWEKGRRKEALALEGLWNDLAKIYPFILFCGYPAGSHQGDSESFGAVCEAHSMVIL